MAEEERFDGFFMNIAQQQQGIDNLLESFFGFLQRKTDFFTYHDDPKVSEQTALRIIRRHAKIARDRKAEKIEEEKKKQEAKRREEEKKKQEEEKRAAEAKKKEKEKEPQIGIVEIDDDEPAPPPPAPTQSESESSTSTSTSSETAAPQEGGIKTDIQMAHVLDLSEKPDGKQTPNPGNGGTAEKYVWTQSLREVDIHIPIPPGTRARDLDIKIQKKHLRVGLKGQPPILDGELYNNVNYDDCLWSVEEQKLLLITLEKVNKMEWWQCVMLGDPMIDTQRVQPENSKLSDLDPDTRGQVEKMMFDSQQKMMGKPTSEETEKQKLLQKFMAAHPELDFSQAKFG